MSEELKPCPFCNGEAQRTESSGLVSCAFEECPAFLLAVPADNWNRRAQPAEAEGVKRWALDVDCLYPSEEGGWCEYGDHLAALSAVTAERDRLLASKLYWVAPAGSGLVRCVTDERYRKFSPSIRAKYDPVCCVDAAMAAKEA